MRAIILGTAGHVDHGKTSLIRALTGIETDRLKEEKNRGITIELGFAHLDLDCGQRLGIVDVPGHEKFVRNMVAGAAGMDMVAFIIAADEGIMPQTREHFEICKLLGIREGLIILTKIDMVEEEWLEMVEEEVLEFFRDSFLEGAPLLRVSSTTGAGVEEVRQVLNDKVSRLDLRETHGPFRLPVDRVFSMKGFGTVITGSAIAGRIRVGDELTLYPWEKTARIRGIQVHGLDVEEVETGHRTAINLQGIEKEEIHRGDHAATPGSMAVTTLIDVVFHALTANPKELKNRTLVRVHVGTREIIGTLVFMDRNQAAPGEEAMAQIILREPAAVWPGDRYVLRSYSPITTIGGGVVVNPCPRKRKRTLPEQQEHNRRIFHIYRSGSDEERLELVIRESGLDGLTLAQLGPRLGIFGKRLKKLLQRPLSAQRIMVVDTELQRYVAAESITRINEDILAFTATYHRENPLKSGLAKEELRSRLQRPIDPKLFTFCLNLLSKKGLLHQEGADIRLPGHRVTLQIDEQKMQDKVARLYRESGLTPPNLRDILARFDEFPQEQIRQVLGLLLQKKILVKVNETLYFHHTVLEELQERLHRYLQEKGEIDAPRFKRLTGLTRKYSIPLLEHFDKVKLTIRIGDKRVLRKNL